MSLYETEERFSLSILWMPSSFSSFSNSGPQPWFSVSSLEASHTFFVFKICLRPKRIGLEVGMSQTSG
jgi:hypothetical protein